jgi:hypothetical protein
LRVRAAKEGRAKIGKEFDIDVETAKLRACLTAVDTAGPVESYAAPAPSMPAVAQLRRSAVG